MKALIVEADSAGSSTLRELLNERAYDVTACATVAEAMKVFREAVFQLLFVDLYLPGVDGFSFCRWVRNQWAGDQPVVLAITTSDQAPDLRKMIEAGADDYVLKPYRKELLDVRLIIARNVLKNREIHRGLEENLLRERERLHYLATHDPRTKLPNRAAFVESLQNAVETARNGKPSALLYIDLDNFDLINHSLGHSAGEAVIAKVAQVLRDSIRSQDVPGQFGRDEFGVLLAEIRLPEAKSIAEGIRSRIEDLHVAHSGRLFSVSSSIGLAAVDGTETARVVIDCADSACHSAKVRGRNRVELYDDNDGKMAGYREEPPRAAEVKEAIRTDGFEILFQPIVNVQTTIPALYEVLIRLPNKGELLPPSDFVPAAERYHLMPEIDRQVISKAVKRLANNNELRLAVNLSGQSFDAETLEDFIEASFKVAGVEPSRVTFEITETAIISNLHAARKVMHRLQEAGFHIALDDFGAGFSSFRYLKDLVPDYLKIDGSFVRDAETGRSDWTFVEVINDLAHRLRIKSIAEFVEQEATLTTLRAIGVDLAQGYFFGKPGPLP